MSSTDEPRYRDAERALWTSHGVAPVERRLDVGEIQGVRVQETGEGMPVVFVHGVSNAGASWAPLVAGLDEVRAIVIDRPGCGLSDPLPDAYADIDRFEHYADRFVVDLLDALGLDRAAVVCTSFGGYLAFRGAAANPGRISHIVEIGWSVGAPVGKLPLVMRVSAIRSIGRLMSSVPPTRGAVRATFRQIGLRQALEAGRVSTEMIDWFLAMLRDTDTMRNELESGPDLIAPVRGLNSRLVLDGELLASIEAAVGFYWGDADPFGGGDVARSFAAHFSDAILEVVPGAGHAPWLDDTAGAAGFTRATLAR